MPYKFRGSNRIRYVYVSLFFFQQNVKPIRILPLVFLVIILTGCVGNQQPLPPPTASAPGVDTAVKYSQWSNGQLELKRAQLRHELDRGYVMGGPPIPMLIAASDRSGRQAEVEEIKAELLRRDPSGALLARSNALLADPAQ
jgi:hypothetical protein